MDERLTCFVAEKHFVKIGSRTGFIKKPERSFIEDRRCICGFGDQRDRGAFFDLAEKRSAVFSKAKYPGIGNMSGAFVFWSRKIRTRLRQIAERVISRVFKRSANWEKPSY